MTTIRVTAHIPAVAHALLAHQGGWDEGLLVAGPLLVIVWLLWLAKRRADKIHHHPTADPAADPTPDTPVPPPESAGDGN